MPTSGKPSEKVVIQTLKSSSIPKSLLTCHRKLDGADRKTCHIADASIPVISGTYAYWKSNSYQFTTDWFLQGYSGWALKLANFAFRVMGVSKDARRFITADSIGEQQRFWDSKLRWVLLNPVMKTVLASP